MIELLARAERFAQRTAIAAGDGSFSYRRTLDAARAVSSRLLGGQPSFDGARVAMMISPGLDYVAVQWGTWLAGGISVPLALSNPDTELKHAIADCGPRIIVAAEEYRARLEALAPGRVVAAEQLVAASSDDPAAMAPACEDALILYTSGTTGSPKGVVWRHEAIRAQVEIMSTAWGWKPDDRALLVLPLHHVHGLINVVTTALWNGAAVEMHHGFDAAATWGALRRGDLTVFMAVPTIYHRLLAAGEGFTAAERDAARLTLSRMRLMVSGSAALPVATLEAWREISGHTLLERYGMTEIGMALSNPYEGQRVPGAVGTPLPTVEARIVDEADEPVAEGTPGRLQVRGPSVFRRYWNKPEATAAGFVDGWFRTGDVAAVGDGVYRIMGRESVDIIKTGGEKVSALEIEDVIRGYPGVADCAVVGIPDAEWGERVAVALIADGALSLDELRDFCRPHLDPAKLPRRLLVVSELPRNALGKVIKPAVQQLFRQVAG